MKCFILIWLLFEFLPSSLLPLYRHPQSFSGAVIFFLSASPHLSQGQSPQTTISERLAQKWGFPKIKTLPDKVATLVQISRFKTTAELSLTCTWQRLWQREDRFKAVSLSCAFIRPGQRQKRGQPKVISCQQYQRQAQKGGVKKTRGTSSSMCLMCLRKVKKIVKNELFCF